MTVDSVRSEVDVAATIGDAAIVLNAVGRVLGGSTEAVDDTIEQSKGTELVVTTSGEDDSVTEVK